MLKLIYKKKFKKDIEKAKRRGKDLSKLKTIMQILIEKDAIPKKYLNHRLRGNYSDCQECHIEPDWLLIYIKTDTEIIFVRTGSHSDLFK